MTDHLGKHEEAEEAYRRAIALDDKSAYPWNNLGYLLADHLGKYEEAKEAYRRAIALDDKFANPWNGLGYLLADHLGKYEEAEEAFRRAIALDDDDSLPYCLRNLARLLHRKGKTEEAADLYRQAVDLTKDNEDVPFLKFQAHLYLGHRAEALSELEKLAAKASAGDRPSFFRLEEQMLECQTIGFGGDDLAELMESSGYADYLRPFILALRAVNNPEVFKQAPQEVAEVARNVYEKLLKGISSDG